MKSNISLLFIALTFTFAANAQETRKVAVFDPAGNVDAAVREIVREEISAGIVNSSGYIVLERQLINKVLEENKFQQGGLVDDSQISEIGKRMGADYVFVTTVSPLDRNYYISCKMIEVVTARIEKQKTAATRNGLTDLVPTIQNVVKTMFAQNVTTPEEPGITSVKETTQKKTAKAETKQTAVRNSRFYAGFGVGIAIESKAEFLIKIHAAYLMKNDLGIAVEYGHISFSYYERTYNDLANGWESYYTTGDGTLNYILIGPQFIIPSSKSHRFCIDIKPMIGYVNALIDIKKYYESYNWENYNSDYKYLSSGTFTRSSFAYDLNVDLRWNIHRHYSMFFSVDYMREMARGRNSLSMTLGANYHF